MRSFSIFTQGFRPGLPNAALPGWYVVFLVIIVHFMNNPGKLVP
jgi:hypothetical protein